MKLAEGWKERARADMIETERMIELIRLRAEIVTCKKCTLFEARQQAVPGNGVWDTDLMFVGEAPGTTEDAHGLPFIGRSGQHLRTLLSDCGIDSEKVFITNVCKCFPPGCRTPTRHEQLTCRQYLLHQLKLVRPKLVVTLGGTAFGAFSLTKETCVTRYRGRLTVSRMMADTVWNLFPLLHPAAALRRQRSWGSQFKMDIAAIPALLERFSVDGKFT